MSENDPVAHSPTESGIVHSRTSFPSGQTVPVESGRHGTGIQWTHAPGFKGETWNCVTGCDRCSPGCEKCYALTMAKRLKAMGQAHYQRDGDPRTSGPGFGVTCHEDALEVPLRWRKPRMVFANSMSDWLHPEIPEGFIARMWDVMVRTPQHTYLLLTKRAQRLPGVLGPNGIGVYKADGLVPCPQRNVWLGVSIENDRYAFRADYLVETPAVVHFLSLEPLIGSVSSLRLDGVEWVIVGGESGSGARPIDLDWVREIRDRCAEAGVPLFVKQLGSAWVRWKAGAAGVLPGENRHGGDPTYWPADLRIREWPKRA